MASDRTADDPLQILDPEGQVVDGATVPDLSDDALVSMYRDMRFARHLDERLISLQRQGRLGTYSSLAGQEGSQIGSMYALDDSDWVLYQYREHGAVVVRGALAEYLQYWMGHESANAALAEVNIAPLNITIGDHLPHAVGMAWASKLKGEDKAFVSHFGDGATSEGDFHEALNFAGVFDTPNVFVCNNNQWAISVPAERQTAAATFAQKAEAYGFEGIRVDGMDPLAMYRITKLAVEKARGDTSGDSLRPTLIEAIQYRYGAHTTADDPSVYREESEVEEWKEKDPIRATRTLPPRHRSARRRAHRRHRKRGRKRSGRRDRDGREHGRDRPGRPVRRRLRGPSRPASRPARVPPKPPRASRRRRPPRRVTRVVGPSTPQPAPDTNAFRTAQITPSRTRCRTPRR